MHATQVLDEKPILTKACTSLVGFSVGDILAQKASVFPLGNSWHAQLAASVSFFLR
jgi:hypothetical protein